MHRNFRIYVDRDGKTPQLRRRQWSSNSHPYYVRYADNKPVAIHGPVEIVATKSTVDGVLKVYDYAKHGFVLASTVSQE